MLTLLEQLLQLLKILLLQLSLLQEEDDQPQSQGSKCELLWSTTMQWRERPLGQHSHSFQQMELGQSEGGNTSSQDCYCQVHGAHAYP